MIHKSNFQHFYGRSANGEFYPYVASSIHHRPGNNIIRFVGFLKCLQVQILNYTHSYNFVFEFS